jgi:DNA helicase II / ATP-dependent DNA helicase PcrA
MQMKLVRKWAESMEYMLVVGDEDQLLYGFCGATPKTMMEPAIDPKHIEILGQSYRVPRSVHALAESMIRRVMKRVEKNYKPREEDGEVLPCVATTREPSSLMSILEKHDKAGESTMILASCSYMLANTLSLLRREGVPFHNPYRKRRGDWNPLAKRKNSQGALDRLLSFLQPSADFPPEWSHGQLAAWSKHVAAQYMKRGAKALLAGEGIEVLTYRDAFEGKEREYLCDFINGAIESETALTWLVERMLASKRPTYRYPLKVIVKRGIEKAQETPRIIPGTIHSTKGGEADNVIIFPDVSNAGFRELVSGGEAADAVIRMFYVGVTRARKRLYICEPTTTARFKIR